MAANRLYGDNILSPKVKFGKLIPTEYGQGTPSYVENFYFDAPAIFGGTLKRWNGAAWIKAKMRVYTGSFANETLKVYKAGTWQVVDKN